MEGSIPPVQDCAAVVETEKEKGSRSTLALALFRTAAGQDRRRLLRHPGVQRSDRARESRVALEVCLDTQPDAWDTALAKPYPAVGAVGGCFGSSFFVAGKRRQGPQE